MQTTELRNLFNEFLTTYDAVKYDALWDNQSQQFRSFWQNKILNSKYQLTVEETDSIIRLLDTKARGHQKTDEAVAQTGVRQGVWGRLFDDLKNKRDIQKTLNEIFRETNELKLIGLIDRLKNENKNNKNGLTGAKANVLNALLFINDPDEYIACVSLSHRAMLMKAFGLGSLDEFKSYGEQIVLSNKRIIEGVKQIHGFWGSPRTLSEFFYAPNIRAYWQTQDHDFKEPLLPEPTEVVPAVSELEFVMETHLEEFLVRNWESTELGRKYELIEEDGEIVSQQYQTDIGRIDLLVKDKTQKQFVVIELKKGQTSDDTVGQVARYMGWVKKKLANGRDVKGIIIAGANDARLQFALESFPNVELFIYKVSFTLQEAERI